MRILVFAGLALAGCLLLFGCRTKNAPEPPHAPAPPVPLPALTYPWKKAPDTVNALANRIVVPEGYRRTEVKAGSFAEWLRFLPMVAGQSSVQLSNGQPNDKKSTRAAVKSNAGYRDLQQCTNAIICLRGEYLFSREQYNDIRFRLANGTPAPYSRWAAGYRPLVRGNTVKWVPTAEADASHAAFREYLNTIYTDAGIAALNRDLTPVKVKEMHIGDLFIIGWFPGHVVIVVDMAVNDKTGEKLFLLAQGSLPAQGIDLLKNPNDDKLSPWYALNFGDSLVTPKYTFGKNDLKGF